MKKSFVFLTAALLCADVFTRAFALQGEFKAIKALESQEKADAKPAILDRPQFQYTSGDQRDPFRTLIIKDEKAGTVQVAAGVEEKPPQMTVQGVIWGGVIPVAIINDEMVKVGDTTKDGAKITSIEKKGIGFLYKDKNFNIPSPAHNDLPAQEL
jgi:hypothetical protein